MPPAVTHTTGRPRDLISYKKVDSSSSVRRSLACARPSVDGASRRGERRTSVGRSGVKEDVRTVFWNASATVFLSLELGSQETFSHEGIHLDH